MAVWHAHPAPFDGSGGNRGCYASDRDEYVAVAATSLDAVVATSSDAVTWSASPSEFDSGSCYAIVRCLSLGLYVAVGASSGGTDMVQTSTDGVTWTGQGIPFVGAEGDAGLSIAVKEGGTPVLMAGGEFFDQPLATSNDGTSWAPLASPFDAVSGLNAVKGVAYSVSEDRWIAVGGDTDGASMVAYSDDDGSSWTVSPNPLDNTVVDVYRDEDGGNWYIVGSASTGEVVAVSTDNGATWDLITSPLDNGEGNGIVVLGGVIVLMGNDADLTITTVESSDAGLTWTTDDSPLDGGIGHGIFASDSVLVQVGNSVDSSVTLASTATSPPGPSTWVPGRRIGIAFDDGPLEPDPTWTWLDGEDFPSSFVTGYDTESGRQSLLSQTETGTATVYVNDRAGLFDDRNTDSPYYGLLSGKQILLQLWNPVTLEWEKQWRGWIENYSYDIDGSAIANPWAAPEDRQPLNASIQIECVDMFDILNGFGLTPGLAGVRPPSGAQDGVWYPDSHVDGRIIEILTDVGIPSEMRGSEDNTGIGDIAEGNVRVVAVKYDPDESALAAIRDACDAEFPFIGNTFIDRRGRFQFHGRYARFQPGHGGDPDAPKGVSDEPLAHWDFHRWKVGDGAAIAGDSDRAQMRVLEYERSRPSIINAALCYPQGIDPADMPNQVFASVPSIEAYGKHDAPPMSDLLTAYLDDGTGLTSGSPNAKRECFKYAKLLVKNQSNPREAITSLQVKAVRPSDARAEATWAFITTSDIGHVVNVKVNYPGGVGFEGKTWTNMNYPVDDYYIEGRALRVRPLNTEHDYVEYEVNVSPANWSMDPTGIFPPLIDGAPDVPSQPIQAQFEVAENDPGVFQFTDFSTPGPSGPITGWAWDFGDGNTDTVADPVNVYAANGVYTVTLTVTGPGGDGTDDEVHTVRVTDAP